MNDASPVGGVPRHEDESRASVGATSSAGNKTRPATARKATAAEGNKTRPATPQKGAAKKGGSNSGNASPAKKTRSGAQRKQAELPRRKPRPVWIVTLFAFVLPGSGQMLNGDPTRGVVMQFFMLLFSYITYQLSSPGTSIVGKLAGGIAIYVIAVLDANGMAKRRMAAWERMVASGEVTETARHSPVRTGRTKGRSA